MKFQFGTPNAMFNRPATLVSESGRWNLGIRQITDGHPPAYSVGFARVGGTKYLIDICVGSDKLMAAGITTVLVKHFDNCADDRDAVLDHCAWVPVPLFAVVRKGDLVWRWFFAPDEPALITHSAIVRVFNEGLLWRWAACRDGSTHVKSAARYPNGEDAMFAGNHWLKTGTELSYPVSGQN